MKDLVKAFSNVCAQNILVGTCNAIFWRLDFQHQNYVKKKPHKRLFC